MFLSHSQSNLTKMLQQFYQPKSYLLTPLSQQLQNITQWVRHYRNDQSEEVQKVLKEIEKRVGRLSYNKKDNKEGNLQWLVIMKSLMLVQHLLCVGVGGNVFEDVLEIVNQALHNLQQHNLAHIQKLQKSTNPKQKPTSSSLTTVTKSHFPQHTIQSKLLQPYHHYLTRRCQLLPKAFSQSSKCHYIINLLNSACKCNQVIYIFARYKHFDEFCIMGEFNMVMARDVGLVYELLREYLRQGVGNDGVEDDRSMNTDNLSLQILAISDIDDILLALHQKLFHIFYNKYHYLKVDRYVPQFIDFDAHYSLVNSTKHSTPSKHNPAPLNNSLTATAKKSFSLQDTMTSLSSSQKTSVDSQKIQRSLELIGDMEKFLEGFDGVVV